jgi:hypothetical protein
MSDLFDYSAPEPHMTRTPDHSTSKKAARKVAGARVTVRSLVLEFATRAPKGFADEAMVKMRPDWSESTARKRRTELTEENIILWTGQEIINDHGNPVKVWIHRNFVPSPPPIVARKAKATRKQLEAEIARLRKILDSHGVGY